MYEIVADVSLYPKFVPFCTSSRILTPSPKDNGKGQQVLDAELTVGFLSFKESYVSTVTCTPYQSVEVSYPPSLRMGADSLRQPGRRDLLYAPVQNAVNHLELPATTKTLQRNSVNAGVPRPRLRLCQPFACSCLLSILWAGLATHDQSL